MAKKIVGIDLGTTNCTMAYLTASEGEIAQVEIPQVTALGVQGESFSLPSFLYFPLKEELSKGLTAVSWDAKRERCIGVLARERGAELPGRVVASAKSWLCHDGVDRRSALLPIDADVDGDGERTSPVAVCAELLTHLREVWEQKMGEEAPFAEQRILVTVPASFDPDARQLVREAAEIAQYPEEVILLEEPQAAFYAWLHRHADDWREILSVGDTVLVVDVGGGTTDFSLIEVLEEDGDLVLERRSVGSHLLLGGDNMDLALAYLAKGKLEGEGYSIDDWQLQSLVHACRAAKETLMGEESSESVDVTVHGRGSGLIAGTLSTKISQAEAYTMLLDGFFPKVGPEERSQTEKRAGIQQVGLPYAQDARVTCQLAKFLSMTGEDDSDTMEHFVVPTAVLFNGGTMQSQVLQERVVEVLNSWAEKQSKDAVVVLPDGNLEYGVSQGATFYGLAREGEAIRIRGGTSRSYYIGVEDAVPAVPGMPTPLRAVCVVPFGMEEGTEQELGEQEFALVVGEQAKFRFFSRATSVLGDGSEPVVGTVVRDWKRELTELHPVETVLDRDDADGKTVRVKLRSRVTELGTLELWSVADDGRKWKLEFDLRGAEQVVTAVKSGN